MTMLNEISHRKTNTVISRRMWNLKSWNSEKQCRIYCQRLSGNGSGKMHVKGNELLL